MADNTQQRARGMPVLRASEIGEYVFCARAWWLHRVAAREPAGGHRRRARGSVAHHRHGCAVRSSRTLLLLAGVLFIAAVVLLLLQTMHSMG